MSCPDIKGAFTITSRHGARCTFHSRTFDADGWLDGYCVDLEGEGFRASVTVGNPGYGHPPSQLFSRLAAYNANWHGCEDWYAPEGEFSIAATCDRTGHVKLSFSIPARIKDADWSASIVVFTELGVMAQVGREADSFFHGLP